MAEPVLEETDRGEFGNIEGGGPGTSGSEVGVLVTGALEWEPGSGDAGESPAQGEIIGCHWKG